MISDKKEWIQQLLDCCRFVPDFGSLNLIKHAKNSFDKYLFLLEMVEGNEGPEIVRALIDSIQIQSDSGAYLVTVDTLKKFLKPGYARAFIDPLARLTFRRPDLASDLLFNMANYFTEEQRIFVDEFNDELRRSHSGATTQLINFIKSEEKKSFFSDFAGVLAKRG
ncbi:MAG: hypothetical protein D6B27_08135 [Gammaproteobacteria bacterium]|nr:MAG: hypothetical protein D6B27_08135 [Gammaproteobacteria bacterium]